MEKGFDLEKTESHFFCRISRFLLMGLQIFLYQGWQVCPCDLSKHHKTKYSPAKTGEFRRIQNYTCFEKDLKDNKHNSLNLAQKYVWIILSLGIICSSKQTVFLKLHCQKTVCFWKQIMSTDKYSSIFSRQMEVTCFVYLSSAPTCISYTKSYKAIFHCSEKFTRQLQKLPLGT